MRWENCWKNLLDDWSQQHYHSYYTNVNRWRLITVSETVVWWVQIPHICLLSKAVARVKLTARDNCLEVRTQEAEDK